DKPHAAPDDVRGQHAPGSSSPLGERREKEGADERTRPRRREEESEHVRAASEDERHDRRQDDDARDAEERDHDAEREEVLRSRLFAEERQALPEFLKGTSRRRPAELISADREEARDDREEGDAVDPEGRSDAE